MCSSPSKVIFCIINVLLLILSLTFTIYGALLTWSRPWLYKYMEGMIMKLTHSLPKEDANLGQRITDAFLNITSHYSIAIFVFGLILVLLSLLGCFGACFNLNCCIIIYLVPLTLVILAQIALISVYFARKDLAEKFLLKWLNKTVYNYKSLKSGTTDSLVLGLLMPALNCCGFYNGSDFQHSKNFDHNDVYDNIPYFDLQYPIPCCKLGKDLSVTENGCPPYFLSTNSNIHCGCAKPFSDYVMKYLEYFVYASIVILILNILTFIFAVVVLKH